MRKNCTKKSADRPYCSIHRRGFATTPRSGLFIIVVMIAATICAACAETGASADGNSPAHKTMASPRYAALAPETLASPGLATMSAASSTPTKRAPSIAPSPTRAMPRSATTSPTSNSKTVLGSNLAFLPIDTALTGSTARSWGEEALGALDVPTTAANVQTMVDWFANEGVPHNYNNPLNLQTPFGGSQTSTAAGAPARERIQAYPTPSDFIYAFPIEMNNGSYPAIVESLKTGRGLEGSAATSTIADELLVYSGNGYDSIPAWYNK